VNTSLNTSIGTSTEMEVTSAGGETGFLSMYHAYETLPLHVDRRLVELTEVRAEIEQLLLRQGLPPESQHVILHPGFEDTFELRITQRPGQFDAYDVGTDPLASRYDAHRSFAAGLSNRYGHSLILLKGTGLHQRAVPGRRLPQGSAGASQARRWL
jgi:hypothetical protein